MSRNFWFAVLRWIVFLPAGMLAGGLAKGLNRLGAGYVGIYEDSFLWPVFSMYDNAIEASATVVVAALVAPAGRTVVAAVMATLLSGLWAGLLAVELTLNQILYSGPRPGILWVLIGSVLGAVHVYREEQQRQSENSSDPQDSESTW